MNKEAEKVAKYLVQMKREFMHTWGNPNNNPDDEFRRFYKRIKHCVSLEKTYNVRILDYEAPIVVPKRKYEILGYLHKTIITPDGREVEVYRIRGTSSGPRDGEVGGWVENYNNLSQAGDCWVGDDAVVCDNAMVCGDATVDCNALVCDNALVCGDATVSDMCIVAGHAIVKGDVYDYCEIGGCSRIGENVVLSHTLKLVGTVIINAKREWYHTMPLLSVEDSSPSAHLTCIGDTYRPDKEYYVTIEGPVSIMLEDEDICYSYDTGCIV